MLPRQLYYFMSKVIQPENTHSQDGICLCHRHLCYFLSVGDMLAQPPIVAKTLLWLSLYFSLAHCTASQGQLLHERVQWVDRTSPNQCHTPQDVLLIKLCSFDIADPGLSCTHTVYLRWERWRTKGSPEGLLYRVLTLIRGTVKELWEVGQGWSGFLNLSKSGRRELSLNR